MIMTFLRSGQYKLTLWVVTLLLSQLRLFWYDFNSYTGHIGIHPLEH
jgi:hypothetical protein